MAREASRAFSYRPLISIITPVFNTPAAWLGEAIDSVLAQAYENWELILIDDGSTLAETLDCLRPSPRAIRGSSSFGGKAPAASPPPPTPASNAPAANG